MEPSSPKDISIETKFESPPRDSKKNGPVSPTDSFLSPTSIALAKRFRRLKLNTNNLNYRLYNYDHCFM